MTADDGRSAAVGRPGRGAGPHVRLGINTCFAVKRWPRPEDWAAVVRNELGLDLVELCADLIAGIDVPMEWARSAQRTRAAMTGPRARGQVR